MITWLALFASLGSPLPVADPLAFAYPIRMVYWIRSGGRIGHVVEGELISIEDDARLRGEREVPDEVILRYRRRADGREDEHTLLPLSPKLDATSIEVIR